MIPTTLVQSAFNRAVQASEDASLPPRLRHRERSKRFVEALADHLRSHYRHRANVAVLSKHYAANRPRFGLNELLYDVLVCETDEIASAENDGRLTFVTRGLWAIESEFARNSREAVFDFNKLVLASADAKLFVGPLTADPEAFLRPLAGPGAYCSGKLFVALAPHPRVWDPKGPAAVSMWEWRSHTWQPTTIDSPGG
jgi:hypothetical protein